MERPAQDQAETLGSVPPAEASPKPSTIALEDLDLTARVRQIISQYQAWITLAVVLFILVALMSSNTQPDLLFIGGAASLAALGVITPKEAFAGFANSGMLTVAALFVVAAEYLTMLGMEFWGQLAILLLPFFAWLGSLYRYRHFSIILPSWPC
jgi:hypothetical protein